MQPLQPKGEIARHFRARFRDEQPVARLTVGPFQTGVFVRPSGQDLEAIEGQWGLIRPGSPARWEMAGKRRRSTNNARSETASKLATFRQAWAKGQRCLVPADWYQEPNWESGKNIWWHLRRADGLPWAIAGLWSEWTDPATGELVPNFTMLTVNCDSHPMLRRLHKPDPDLPADQQDKRSLVHIPPDRWEEWLRSENEASVRALLTPAPEPDFDQADAQRTDAVLQNLPPKQASLL